MLSYDEIALIAQKISHSVEDNFFDHDRINRLNSIFRKYLGGPNSNVNEETYYAVVKFGQRDEAGFLKMVEELKENGLIS